MNPTRQARGADEPGMLAAPAPRLDPDLLGPPPVPTLALYGYFPAHAPRGTAIARTWAPGDAERCDLCPKCCRHGNQCLILIHGRVVPPNDVAMFSSRGAAGIGPTPSEQLARSR